MRSLGSGPAPSVRAQVADVAPVAELRHADLRVARVVGREVEQRRDAPGRTGRCRRGRSPRSCPGAATSGTRPAATSCRRSSCWPSARRRRTCAPGPRRRPAVRRGAWGRASRGRRDVADRRTRRSLERPGSRGRRAPAAPGSSPRARGAGCGGRSARRGSGPAPPRSRTPPGTPPGTWIVSRSRTRAGPAAGETEMVGGAPARTPSGTGRVSSASK